MLLHKRKHSPALNRETRASLADASQIFLDRPFRPGVYNLSRLGVWGVPARFWFGRASSERRHVPEIEEPVSTVGTVYTIYIRNPTWLHNAEFYSILKVKINFKIE